MSSKRVEKNISGQKSETVGSSRQKQTWAPNQPIVFATSTNSINNAHTSVNPHPTCCQSPLPLVNRQSDNGSSRFESKSLPRIWAPGQDITFGISEASRAYEPSICPSWASTAKTGAISEFNVLSDAPPQAFQEATEGSSRVNSAKAHRDAVLSPERSTQSSVLRSDPYHVSPASPLLSSKPVTPQAPPTKNSTRLKSTVISPRDRVTSPQKLAIGLPNPSPYQGQSSSSSLRKAVPRQRKLLKDIPTAISEYAILKEEENERRAKDLAEKEKADELLRREKKIKDKWEASLGKKVDNKLSDLFRKWKIALNEISKIRNGIHSTSILLRRLHDECRKRQTVEDDIKQTMSEIQLAEELLAVGPRTYDQITKRWEAMNKKRHSMNLRLSNISENSHSVDTAMAALQVEFGDMQKSRDFKNIQDHPKMTELCSLIKKLERSDEAISTLSHRWRAYVRATFDISHSPVPAAHAYNHTAFPIQEQADELVEHARDFRKLLLQLKAKFRASIRTCASNSILNCEKIRGIIVQELGALGTAKFQSSDPSHTNLNDRQRQTWRPFMLQLFSASELRSQLWHYCRAMCRNGTQKAKLRILLREFGPYRRSYRAALHDCIEATWARMAIDNHRGVLPPFAEKKGYPQAFPDSDNKIISGTDMIACPSLPILQSEKTPSYWQFNRYRTIDGEKISVHICTSVHTSERVARLFSDDKVLGFDLEWKPNARRDDRDYVALLQLANDKHVALFHLSRMELEFETKRSPDELLPRNIAPMLRSILENKQVRKVGVNIKADCTRLATTYQVDMAGLFELSHLHQQLSCQSNSRKVISRRVVSLDKQATEHLGLPIAKGSERCSNWHRPLTLGQIFYAANDAYASFMLFWTMIQKRERLGSDAPPLPFPAEDNIPIPIPKSGLPSGVSMTTSNATCLADPRKKLPDSNLSSSNQRAVDPLNGSEILNFNDSVSMYFDGMPKESRSNASLVYAASVAGDWAVHWWNCTKKKEVSLKNLECYFLAQKGLSLELISVALVIPDLHDIARRLLSVSRESQLKLSEDISRMCLFKVCFGNRAESMSIKAKSLIKEASPQAWEEAQAWMERNLKSRHTKHDHPRLLSYALKRECDLSLEDIAFTFRREIGTIADYIVDAVRVDRYNIDPASLRELKIHTTDPEMKIWCDEEISRIWRSQQGETAGVLENGITARSQRLHPKKFSASLRQFRNQAKRDENLSDKNIAKSSPREAKRQVISVAMARHMKVIQERQRVSIGSSRLERSGKKRSDKSKHVGTPKHGIRPISSARSKSSRSSKYRAFKPTGMNITYCGPGSKPTDPKFLFYRASSKPGRIDQHERQQQPEKGIARQKTASPLQTTKSAIKK
ncbi:MAG: hypothetical protein Q9160_009025 [Pyrenula sp. 1 TL-2023]